MLYQIDFFRGSKPKCKIDKLEENFCYIFKLYVLKLDDFEYKSIEEPVLFKGCTRPDVPGILSLCRAVKKSQEHILRRFIIAKPELLNIRGNNNLTPLAVATINGDKPISIILLSAGADVEIGCPINGRTPLHLAMFHGKLEIAKILLAKRADTKAVDCIGAHFGHYAVDGNQFEAVKFSVEHNVDLETKDLCGFTMLLRAVVMHASINIIKFLLECDSDFHAVDRNSLSCLNHAKMSGQNDVLNLIEKFINKKRK